MYRHNVHKCDVSTLTTYLLFVLCVLNILWWKKNVFLFFIVSPLFLYTQTIFYFHNEEKIDTTYSVAWCSRLTFLEEKFYGHTETALSNYNCCTEHIYYYYFSI